MKKLNILLTLFIGLITFSCSTDDNDNEENTFGPGYLPNGAINVNGEFYPLTKGFLKPNYTGNDPGLDPRRYYLILTNGDVSLSNETYTFSNYTTQLVDFNMYSSVEGSGTVENTTYPIYDPSDPDFNLDGAFIDHSGVNTDVVIENGSYISATSLSTDDLSGSASIIESFGSYSISFSYSNNDNTIYGAFNGQLTILD